MALLTAGVGAQPRRVSELRADGLSAKLIAEISILSFFDMNKSVFTISTNLKKDGRLTMWILVFLFSSEINNFNETLKQKIIFLFLCIQGTVNNLKSYVYHCGWCPMSLKRYGRVSSWDWPFFCLFFLKYENDNDPILQRTFPLQIIRF